MSVSRPLLVCGSFARASALVIPYKDQSFLDEQLLNVTLSHFSTHCRTQRAPMHGHLVAASHQHEQSQVVMEARSFQEAMLKADIC